MMLKTTYTDTVRNRSWHAFWWLCVCRQW